MNTHGFMLEHAVCARGVKQCEPVDRETQNTSQVCLVHIRTSLENNSPLCVSVCLRSVSSLASIASAQCRPNTLQMDPFGELFLAQPSVAECHKYFPLFRNDSA